MSGPWWTPEASPGAPKRFGRTLRFGVREPALVPASRKEIQANLLRLAPGFVPEWTDRSPLDAGVALVQLDGFLLELIHQRANRYAEKTLTEYLRTAGVEPVPASPAAAFVGFKLSEAATGAVPLTPGFQIGAPAGDESGQIVVFETQDAVTLAPLQLKSTLVRRGARYDPIELSDEEGFSFLPFGEKARPGRSMYLGFSIKAGVLPGPALSILIRVYTAPGSPPPVAVGGVIPTPGAPAVRLEWEVLDGARYVACEVVRDGTVNLQRTGIVELRLPDRWQPGVPEFSTADSLLWLRLRFVFGQISADPRLSGLLVNTAECLAARTIFDEVLEPVGSAGKTVTEMRLSQRPVLPGTLILEVSSSTGDSAEGAERWTEVPSLSGAGPDDAVYTLDSAAGLVHFGDGVHGRRLPAGFRHVRAIRYQTGGGRAGAVDAGKIKALLSSAPFVTGASNPLPASGGADAESREATLRRGPEEIRARQRAVTEADYELMAARSPGASVGRAHAVSGLHPAFSGKAIPGVVAVFVLPREEQSGSPPLPDQGTLRAVATFLSQQAAPAGVQVVAAAPRFHTLKLEAAVHVDPAADQAAAIRNLLDTLDTYFSPWRGGDEGEGWPFGEAVRNHALLRRILRVPSILAVVRLTLIADGIRLGRCADFVLSPNSLLWASGHEIVTVSESEVNS